jgi:hypothetical protein
MSAHGLVVDVGLVTTDIETMGFDRAVFVSNLGAGK